MRYDLVIFDNDGVLVDSERLANTVLAEYLTELGHPTTYEESVRDYMGSAVHRIHEVVLERTSSRLPAEFDATLLARTLAAFERELQPIPGIVEVLEKLVADQVPYCVASSSSHERIRVGHRKTGLDAWFRDGTIFSAQDVGRGKPEPDLFLHAAERMGCAPERCVVVEDSRLGVAAANAAGMDVYGFTAMTPAVGLADAQGHFTDMAELPGLLV
ncbi:HAD family hydrolase [Streptomyces sp. NPDC059176]|uniref:HAD family hydrolase n=1 Tax=unclassified Streptomyces TaxID=2593676 RepID=UPI0036A9EE66